MINSLVRFARFFSVMLLVGLLATNAIWAATVVQVNMNCGIDDMFGARIQSYQIQLYDSQTPITVANFMNYVNQDDYNNTIIHRDIPGFILQGGGFKLQVNNENIITGVTQIPTDPPIVNEFSASRSNLRGTIAMAKLGGDPNSATSQWFFNLANNSANLDNQNGGFTVFGRVAGQGMTLIDGIASLNITNLNPIYYPSDPIYGPFSDVPMMQVVNPPNPPASYFVKVNSVDVVTTVAWHGGSASGVNDWGVADNWDPSAKVPGGAGTNLSIGDSNNLVIDLVSADRTVGNIYYTNSGKSTTIQSTGGKTLTIDNNGTTATVNVLGSQTISAKMALKSNTVFSVNGSLALSNAISGVGGLGKNDIGTLTLSGANTFTGAVKLYGGTTIATQTSNLGAGTILEFDGSTLQFGGVFDPSLNTGLVARTITIKDGGAIFDIQANNIPITGIIGGTGSLTELGTGTLSLSGANTFIGAVNIQGGTIKANSTNSLGAGTVINFGKITQNNDVNSGLQFDGVFDLTKNASNAARTLSFLSGTVTLDTQANNITLANSIGNGGSANLKKLGSGVLTLSASPNYLGSTTIGGGTLKLGTGAFLPSATSVNLTAANAILDLNDNSQTLAAISSIGGSEIKLGSGTLTDTGNTSTAIAGKITGTGSFTKNGAGTLTLSGANTFTGTLNLHGGIINATNTSNLGNGTALDFNNGTLQFAGAFDPSLNADTTPAARAITIQAGGAVLDTQQFNVPLTGVIGGTGSLTKKGTGTLTLSGVNTFTGAVNVNGGMIKANTTDSFGAGTVINLKDSGVLFDGVFDLTQNASKATRTVSFQSGIVTLDTQANDITLGNSIGGGGSGSLNKLGSGMLTLPASPSYLGSTTIDGGTLKLLTGALLRAASAVSLTHGTAILDINGNTQTVSEISSVVGSEIKLGSGTLTDTGNTSTAILGNITGTGGNFIKNGTGTLTLSGVNTYTGTTQITNGTLIATKAASLAGYNNADKVTVSATATLAIRAGAASGEWIATEIDTLLSGTTKFNANSLLGIDTTGGNFTYNGIIKDGVGAMGLTKLGTNVLTLRGANTFTGPVNFNAGLINAAALNNLGAGTVLNFNGGGLQFNSAFDPSDKTMNFNANGATLDTQALTITLAKAIGNAGTGGLTKKGSGILSLMAANSYTGNTVVSEGMLKALSAASLPGYNASNKVTVNNGATLSVRAGATTGEWSVAQIKDLLTNAKFNAGSFFDIDTAGGNFAYSEIIPGTLIGLSKSGINTLTLTGVNTFTGPVNFNGGLIKAAVAGNLGSGASLNFNGGGLQFDGSFDLAGRTMTFLAGGATLDTQANNISLTSKIGNGGVGGLTKNGTGILELTGEISYSGATTINGGTLKINNNLTDTLSAISGTGGLTVNGATTVLNASSIKTGTLTIGAGSKVVIAPILGGPIAASESLTAVPEPSSLALLSIAAIALLAAAWRRKR